MAPRFSLELRLRPAGLCLAFASPALPSALQFKRLPLLADQSGGGLLVGVTRDSVGVGAVGPLSTYRLAVCFSAAVGIIRYTQVLFTPMAGWKVYSFVGPSWISVNCFDLLALIPVPRSGLVVHARVPRPHPRPGAVPHLPDLDTAKLCEVIAVLIRVLQF